MELSGLPPIGAHGALAAQQPVKPPPEVTRVAPGDASTKGGHDPGNAAGSAHAREAARDIFDKRRDQDADARKIAQDRPDPDQPTGPPPAFQITLLEVEADLQNMIARIEAARSQERQGDWVKAAPEAAAPEAAVTDVLSGLETGQPAERADAASQDDEDAQPSLN